MTAGWLATIRALGSPAVLGVLASGHESGAESGTDQPLRPRNGRYGAFWRVVRQTTNPWTSRPWCT